MSTKKVFLLTDDTGKIDKSKINRVSEQDNFLQRALIKNAASKKRYTSNKLFSQPNEIIENGFQLRAAESWLLTG